MADLRAGAIRVSSSWPEATMLRVFDPRYWLRRLSSPTPPQLGGDTRRDAAEPPPPGVIPGRWPQASSSDTRELSDREPPSTRGSTRDG